MDVNKADNESYNESLGDGNGSSGNVHWRGTQPRIPYSTLAIVLTVLPVTAIIIIVVFGNLLVIVAVLRDKRLKTQLQNWLILSLSIADLLVGLVIMPITLTYELLDYWVLGQAMCDIWLALDVLFVTASILNLCAISLDRYWSLSDPVYYTTKRTVRHTLLMILCVWMVAFLVSCPLIIGWRDRSPEASDQCLLSEDLAYVLYSSCGSFFIPVVTLLVVYVRIYRITRRRSRRNLKCAKRKQEMLKNFEGDADVPDSSQKSKQSGDRRSTGSLDSGHQVCGVVGDGLLRVAWNIAAITRGSISEFSMSPLSPVSDSPWPQPFRQHPKLVKGLSGSSILSAQGSKPVPCNSHVGKDREIVTAMQRDRTNTFNTADPTTMSMRTVELQRHVGHRKKCIRRRERQATSLLGLIVLAFIGCWMPFFSLYVIRAVCCEPPDLLFDIIFWLGYCNSAFNPFIYNFFNPEFRQAFIKILVPRRRNSF